MYKNIEKEKVLELKNLVEYQEGQTIIMQKNIPHSVYGEERSKMLLVVSF